MTNPTAELVSFLQQEIENTRQFYDKLQTNYDASIYESFERTFLGSRNFLKNKLMILTDPDHSYLNKSALRKQYMEDCIHSYTKVIQRFEVARERGGGSRAETANSLEDLLISLANLKHVILESGSR